MDLIFKVFIVTMLCGAVAPIVLFTRNRVLRFLASADWVVAGISGIVIGIRIFNQTVGTDVFKAHVMLIGLFLIGLLSFLMAWLLLHLNN